MSWYHYLLYLLIYTLGYCFLVFATLADGHGTFLFAGALIGWILFAAAVMLIPSSQSKPFLVASLLCISAYYLTSVAVAIVEQTGEGNFERTVRLLNQRPALFTIAVIWYLAGQVFFWYLLRERLQRRIEPRG